uniref:rRNA N-glycosylase n=1 Tax=Oryza punctata TaxID=4537 RepID=A0A0E0MIM5_ORYPU
MQDINKHRYVISVNAGREEFERLMMKRQGRMLDICSTTVDGMPVTPPKLELAVPLLFRETDLYFVAFRPLDRDNDDPNSANGWFHFNEEAAIIPSFLNSHEIHYSYGYIDVTNYRVGASCLPDIYFCLCQYTPANARLPSAQRRRALMVSCLMLAETQRFMQMQRELSRISGVFSAAFC